MNWSAGYITEVDYIYGYYRELSPGILRLACVAAGVMPPEGKSLNYLELGFGQGTSLNIHAAANSGTYWGNDFNPTHVAHASALADAAQSGVTLLDDSFAELAARDDLPEFDIIGLHGIWTWISDENRHIIVDIVRRKLRVGGALYISYNCFPGWAPAMPLRHLMKLHADLAGSDEVGIGARLDAALTFASQVVDSGAAYFRNNPGVGKYLNNIKKDDRNYLAHEFLTGDWDIMTFSDVVRWLDDAKVSFAGSAHVMNYVEVINLSTEAQKMLAGIQHPILKQSVRDYFVSEQFRRDIFIKGPRRLSGLQQADAFRAQAFALMTHPDDVPMTIKGPMGEAQLQDSLYQPLVHLLADHDYAPKTLAKLAADPKLSSFSAVDLYQAILILVGAGHVQPAQQSNQAVRKQSQALNRYLCEGARYNQNVAVLASPIIGSGVPVSRIQQLFLLALRQNHITPETQAAFVWQALLSIGQRVIKEGKTLESPEENLAELTSVAAHFAEKRLPILKALEVV